MHPRLSWLLLPAATLFLDLSVRPTRSPLSALRAQAAPTVAPTAPPQGPASGAVPGGPSSPRTAGGPAPGNRPPSIRTTLPTDSVQVLAGEPYGDLRFRVTVDDADGDPVSLHMLHVPAGLTFEPLTSAPAGASAEVYWTRPSLGRAELSFEATDGSASTRRTLVVEGVSGRLLTGDVTGDGIRDEVAGAHHADVGGIQDAGAVYVWAGGPGGSGTQLAQLVRPGAVAFDSLSDSDVRGIRLGDVDGDGVDDVVVVAPLADEAGVVDAGVITVWRGGASLRGAPAPLATLETATSFGAGAQLGDGAGPSVLLEDVTGDGIRDVVASCSWADAAGVADSGAIVVWAGGAGLSGTPAPTAVLLVPDPASGDSLSLVAVGDVSGDGIDDVVGTASTDVGGVPDAGAIHVWFGGTTLTGSVEPSATLHAAVPTASDGLGFVRLQDLVGDGVLDVVGAAPFADVGGVVDAGAVYVWEGGAALTGSLAPYWTLEAPTASTGDRLGFLLGADLDGDGLRDVVAGSQFADSGGVPDVGVYQVWSGASPAGTPAPALTLTVPGPVLDGRLLLAGVADVTGDGRVDLIGVNSTADVGPVVDAGSLYVWPGGPGFFASSVPGATLQPSAPSAGDTVGSGASPLFGGVELADLTGDGVLDVLAGSASEDGAGGADVGGLHVWAGGAGLTGTVAPLADLQDSSALVLARITSGGVVLDDVSGDGILDVLAGTPSDDALGVLDAGSVRVWRGGATLAGSVDPSALLAVPSAADRDFMTLVSGYGLLTGDVTGDGVADVVAGGYSVDVSGAADAGAVRVWPGGGALLGVVAPAASLSLTGSVASDQLGFTTSGIFLALMGQGIQLADVSGDGVLDVVAGASRASVNGVSATGAIGRWFGGAGLAGGVPVGGTLFVLGAKAGDSLGE